MSALAAQASPGVHSGSPGDVAPLLRLENLDVYYGAIHALRGVSVSRRARRDRDPDRRKRRGQVHPSAHGVRSGRARSGRVVFLEQNVTRAPASMIVSHGLVHCPEGRRIFANMTVRENLELGAYLRRDRAAIAHDLEHALDLFPRLRERLAQSAGTLSGGEQQMLAIGRSLLTRPKLLMLDEPSLGLAPNLVRDIFRIIETINREDGTAVLLVEQNAHLALGVAHRGYVLETGAITLEGPAKDLRANPEVQRATLGEPAKDTEQTLMTLNDDNIADYADTLVLQVRGGEQEHELDYSEASVSAIEGLLRVSDELFRLPAFPDNQRNLVVFYNGCYLGEVISRQLGGTVALRRQLVRVVARHPLWCGRLAGVPSFKSLPARDRGTDENDLVAYYDGMKRKLAEPPPGDDS
jgi:branched-chain amino acid transport system ATP-binding protein